MSASEKLKALEAAMWNDNGPEEGSLGVYLMALPQIVAVVEADEAITLRPDVNGMPPRDCGYVRFSEIEALRAALTALEEALS